MDDNILVPVETFDTSDMGVVGERSHVLRTDTPPTQRSSQHKDHHKCSGNILVAHHCPLLSMTLKVQPMISTACEATVFDDK